MKSNFIDSIEAIYFIGIGGISMSALAKYMLALKKKVGGSDINFSAVTAWLKSLGAFIDDGTCDLTGYDTVVYTDAIPADNRQLKLARALRKNVIPRGKFLKEVCRCFESVVAVSGCHGKTTCTAMLANIYYFSGRRFMSHIGGRDINLTNFYYSGNNTIITEACEYKKNFLSIKPDIAVVLNCDFDHADCYSSADELRECYHKFAVRAVKVICMYGDLNIPQAITFGFDKNADYSAEKVKTDSSETSFCLCVNGKERGKIGLKVYGKHNVLNALAACAAAESAGFQFGEIKTGLEKFSGVERRMEKLGYKNGILYIADYAHHPNEIIATIKTVKSIVKGKIFVIFQPHTYSRTKKLFRQFVGVLGDIQNLLIYKTYAAREYYDDEGSALTLSNAVKKSCYGENVADIENFISKAKEGDVLLFLGAGDIYYIAKNIFNS